jgi:hypothetical protein
MRDTASADRFDERPSPARLARAGHPIELWRLRGARAELRGLALETAFGCAFRLELADELVLFRMYRSVEPMVAFAGRLEAALIADGWVVIEEAHEWRTH